MKILADEGFNGIFIRKLRELSFQIDWIVEISPGISDEEVIEIAKTNNQILLTEDKDFGEWVFAHQVSGLTIIFVRYQKEEQSEIVENLAIVLGELLDDESGGTIHEFITINRNKIRRRII